MEARLSIEELRSQSVQRLIALLKEEMFGEIKRTWSTDKENETEIHERNKVCSICLENFIDNSKVRITPCNHIFHEVCMF